MRSSAAGQGGPPPAVSSWRPNALVLLFAAFIVGVSLEREVKSAFRAAQHDVVLAVKRTSLALGGTASLQVRPYAGDEIAAPGCQPPKLDLEGLQEYNCRILENACFDQNKILVHNPPDEMEFPYPFYDFGWVPAFIPGWAEKAKRGDAVLDADGNVMQPMVRKNSTADREDLTDPLFSECYTPLVWASPWAVQYGEFFFNSFVPLYWMQSKLKLFDRNILLAPILDGYRKQQFMENLLRPYTNKMIMPFNELSSRQHMFDPRFPRCFKTVALCALKGLYVDRPVEKYYDPVENLTMYDGDKSWKWYRPHTAAQSLVEYYRSIGELPAVPQVADRGEEGRTLQVVVCNRTTGYRHFLRLQRFIDDCNAWTPPPASGFSRVRCIPRTWLGGDHFLEEVDLLQRTHIMVGHHGAELNNAFFLPSGASLIEVRMKDFPEDWGNVYFSSTLRTENEVFYWQARVVKDETWRPSVYEEKELPNRYYEVDRHTVLRWEQWEPILERVAAFPKDKAAYEALKYPHDIRWLI